MAKQQASQKYIFKISTGRLKRTKWNLTLPIIEARKNDEIISLNDSQMLRWIDELNGIHDAEAAVAEIRQRLKVVKKLPHSVQNKREIRKLYDELDKIQFKPDYMHLVIDKPKDLYKACKGFRINGIRYKRLLGTSGGVKNATIVFVSERLVDELRKRIDNGRDTAAQQIPAKLEAYRALTCSGSIPVSMPQGILVVPDCETIFKEDIISLNDENTEEPAMEYVDDFEITLNCSDGFGLMSPSLAKRWSEELRLGYTAGGMNTRFAWEKGMVFCFDFHEFAEKVAGKRIVKDVWGNDVDIMNVELILTASMLKLWKCYESLEQYLACCAENKYTFGITKVCPRELENWRGLNYQFIQSYHLTDEQIDELIRPTVEELNDVIHGDYRKAILFLRGMNVTDENASVGKDDYVKALMIDERMFDDPFVRKNIFNMIKRRLTDAKIGVIGVHGNYSIMSGDPYALCQSVFGMEVTGLLKAGQIYNQYWRDIGAKDVACFRAPMTCHNNIRKREVARSEEMDHWYQYMNANTIMNAWDSTCQALNGADFDGDLIMLTDNKILVDNIRPTRTIFCAQRKGEKISVGEADLVASNIASFGDDIGRTTNWITSMFDVQSKYPQDSEEYKVLDYRIKCGQLFQQNCIDKAKGIVCKPMPKGWYDYHGNALPENPSDEDIQRREFCLSILADKKPYFMRYIYPSLMSQYNDYKKNTNAKCIREFRLQLSDLLGLKQDELTEEQRAFIGYYSRRMPVSMNDCVTNRICRRFENAFDGILMMDYSTSFDYSILKSDAEYSNSQYDAIERLYQQHTQRVMDYARAKKNVRVSNDEQTVFYENINRVFRGECLKVCSNAKQLCDIVIDLCYKRSGTKQFAWSICGEEIIENLLEKNGGMISYPTLDENGDITYGGYTFSFCRKEYDDAGNHIG